MKVRESRNPCLLHLRGARWLAMLLAILVITPFLHAQDEDFDQYKIRISGFWFYSNPSVTMEGEGHNGFVDFNRDFGFNTYSTFAGKFDWKFTRKNHFYVTASPFSQSRQVVLNRTVNFRGQTFPVGLTTKGDLQATLIAPGYQYDVIRRKRGHLGLAVQVNLFNTKGTLSAAAQVLNGVQQAARSAQGSLLAPIPVAGPEFRLYLTNSPRLFVEGNVYGMYFFGYGNFLSSAGDLGLSLSKHFSINAGYSMGSRLNVNDGSSRIGLSLTQKGPIVGAEVSF
jgi:hypothetical protein